MRATIIVKGNVQHVGYRNFVRLAAKRYTILGLVRNLANGDVEVFAEGESEKIDAFAKEIQSQNDHTRAVVENEQLYPEGSSNYKGPWKDFRGKFLID